MGRVHTIRCRYLFNILADGAVKVGMTIGITIGVLMLVIITVIAIVLYLKNKGKCSIVTAAEICLLNIYISM